jgi:TIR domain
VADVFISHAYSDRETAMRVAKGLRARGLSVFRAPSMLANLRPNDRWHAKIYDELDEAGVVVALFSYRASGRPWMIAEASIAEFQGKLISISLEQQATPGPLAHTEFLSIDASAFAPQFGFFGPSRAEDDLDRLALAVRERQDSIQAARVDTLSRLQRAEAPPATSPEALADALPFGFGAEAGSAEVESRRTAFVAAVRSLEQASNPDVSNAARAFVSDGPRADSIARLYAAIARERQPLAWRRFGEAALPHGVYAALAGLERAGLSQRQINERIAPQSSSGLLRARFGDRLFDSVGAAAFVALIALVGSLVLTNTVRVPNPGTVSAAIPPAAESVHASAASTDRVGPVAPARPSVPAPSPVVQSQPPQPQAAPPVEPRLLPPPAPANAPRAAPVIPTRPHNAPRPVIAGAPSACRAGPLSGAATMIVNRGDMLSQIALACYGEASAWSDIVRCNPRLGRRNLSGVYPLTGPDLLYVGERLVLPAPGGACPV